MASKAAPPKSESFARRLWPQKSSSANVASQKTPAKGVTQAPKESSITRWFRETKSELRKVVWPSRETATNLTILVIVVSVVVGLVLGVIDMGFQSLFQLLLGT